MSNNRPSKKAVLIKKRRENEVKRHIGDLVKKAPAIALYKYLTGTRNPVSSRSPEPRPKRDPERLQRLERLIALYIILQPILSSKGCGDKKCPFRTESKKRTSSNSKTLEWFFGNEKKNSRKSK
ncbi:MAG: hypothetical protein K2Y01_09230 [Rhabdochlamydiaceae bacterium]|nr:hypothetical protein [Rhabdochlamydiaceae bacterium]